MRQEVFLLKEGEIILKGLNRSNFEQTLIKNIKTALQPLKFEIYNSQSVILIQPNNLTDMPQIEMKLKKIFGIVCFCKAIMCEKTTESIFKTIKTKFDQQLSSCKTFRLKTKRSDKAFPLNSQQINKQIGALVTSKFQNLTVDLSNDSDITIFIEIRTLGAYIYDNILNGAGGIPIDKRNEGLLLLSGGIDSPVAGWLMAKRGIKIQAIHFFSPPYTSQRALEKVETILKNLASWIGKIPFFCVNFTKIQETIKKECNQTLTTILTRKFMNKIAQQIAFIQNKNYNCNIKALVNGESLGQVASQTLDAICCTQNEIELPILQPLIGMDKIEIINIAKKIGTFQTSILPYEDCCTAFIPNHPKTKPKINETIENEKNIKNLSELLNDAVKNVIFKQIN